jgi:hypothetical protein
MAHQDGRTVPATSEATVTFDSVLSIALTDLLACSECDEPTSVVVVGQEATHTAVIPFCLSCYSESAFADEPVHRVLMTH